MSWSFKDKGKLYCVSRDWNQSIDKIIIYPEIDDANWKGTL